MNDYMSLWVSLGIVGCGILIVTSILRAIVKKNIPETHGIMWLVAAAGIVLGGCFPGAIIWLAEVLHVSYPPAVIFTLAILLLFYLLFRCSMWIAGMTMRMQELGMQVSLLNQENLMLMEKLDKLEKRE